MYNPIMKNKVPPVMLDFMAYIQENAEEAMGYLKSEPGMSVELFHMFFEDIARGVDYIYQKYGTTFDEIIITDEDVFMHMGCRIDEENNTTDEFALVISRADIKEMCQYYGREAYASTPKTTPYKVSCRELVTLLGVEEAFHQHQFRTEPGKYIPHFQPLQCADNPDPDYAANIIEADAEIVVREAAREMGFFHRKIDRGLVHVADIVTLETGSGEENVLGEKPSGSVPPEALDLEA